MVRSHMREPTYVSLVWAKKKKKKKFGKKEKTLCAHTYLKTHCCCSWQTTAKSLLGCIAENLRKRLVLCRRGRSRRHLCLCWWLVVLVCVCVCVCVRKRKNDNCVWKTPTYQAVSSCCSHTQTANHEHIHFVVDSGWQWVRLFWVIFARTQVKFNEFTIEKRVEKEGVENQHKKEDNFLHWWWVSNHNVNN